MTLSFRMTFKIAFAIGLALVSQSAFAQIEVGGDFNSEANSFFTFPADPTVTAINLTVTSVTGTQLRFIDDIDSETEAQQLLWKNVTWDSDVGRIDTTLLGLKFGTPTPPYRLTLSTLTLKDMDLNPDNIQFGFFGTNTALVLNNASVRLGRNPVFISTSQLSLRSEGTAGTISSIRELTGNQLSPTAIDVASGTTLRFFESGSLTPGLQDSSRSNFNQPNNSAVINGTLDIDHSYVIFNTGPDEEMLVNSTGLLTLNGSQTVLETGDLRVDGGTVDLGIGGARLETNDFDLTDATVNVGASSTVESSGGALVSGTNTIDLGENARYSVGLLATNGGSVTISGTGTVSTPQVGFVVSGDLIAVTESARLEVTSDTGTQSLARGSIDIGADATVDIQVGAAVVAPSDTINNDGSLLVSGRIEPTGTMTGDGVMRVETGGQLGGFGGDGTDTFTTSNDVYMEGLSTFQVLLVPDLVVAQQLVANGVFALNSQTGVYLDPLVLPGDDVLLVPGTKFAIADYLDGNDLIGYFIRDDKSIISEGDLITEGLNTFRLSYNDPDYGAANGGNSSVISLTVVPDTHPIAGADAVDRFPSQSVKVSVATLLSNDVDPETGTNAGLSITAVNNPGASPATVTLSGGIVFYSPNGHLTADTFEYTVQNSLGQTATGTVTVSLIVDTAPSQNVISFKLLGDGSAETVFGGIPGRTYRIQTTENLINWTDAATVVADGVGRLMFTDPPPLPPSRFYRTVSP